MSSLTGMFQIKCDDSQCGAVNVICRHAVEDLNALKAEVKTLTSENEVYARFAEQFGDLSNCYDAEDVVKLMTQSLAEEREISARLREKLKEVADNTAHDCFEEENNGTDVMPYVERHSTGKDCYRCEIEALLAAKQDGGNG